MKSVVVTGVSTGIGWGVAKVLIGQGVRVFGSVRKAADAERLAKEFGPNFVPLVFDVTDERAVAQGAEQVRQALGGEPLFGLVNNAGIAVAGPLLKLPIADFRQQMEVNLTGVVIVSQAFAPLLSVGADGRGQPGRIVNISSVGGRSSTPFMAPYNASKFALEGLSGALRRELLLFGVDVIVVAPGAVKTAIWGKAQEVDISPYKDTPYYAPLEKVRAFMNGAGGLPPETLGKVVAKALTTAKPKTRYTVAPNPVQHFILSHMPDRMADRAIGKRLGLLP
ncbi:SDR family oxidoreductase [Phenylobacterium aquaticum]|uniref:SDR family oxidoreductase n=1 Tax=Phenylobacterium aquaticum TaxID=1763816 RepID=UPI0026F26714|nr:SDR family oxidoreductase [Phenylobacterium aquaticum]